MSMVLDRIPQLEDLDRELKEVLDREGADERGSTPASPYGTASTKARQAPEPPPIGAKEEAGLPSSWAGGLALAWILIGGSLIAFEPPPQDPNAPVPVWAGLLAMAFLASLFVTMAGLAGRRSWAPTASFVAGLSAVALAVGCLGTEHHSMPYPVLETAGFGVVAWLSWRGMRAARSPSS